MGRAVREDDVSTASPIACGISMTNNWRYKTITCTRTHGGTPWNSGQMSWTLIRDVTHATPPSLNSSSSRPNIDWTQIRLDAVCLPQWLNIPFEGPLLYFASRKICSNFIHEDRYSHWSRCPSTVLYWEFSHIHSSGPLLSHVTPVWLLPVILKMARLYPFCLSHLSRTLFKYDVSLVESN